MSTYRRKRVGNFRKVIGLGSAAANPLHQVLNTARLFEVGKNDRRLGQADCIVK